MSIVSMLNKKFIKNDLIQMCSMELPREPSEHTMVTKVWVLILSRLASFLGGDRWNFATLIVLWVHTIYSF